MKYCDKKVRASEYARPTVCGGEIVTQTTPGHEPWRVCPLCGAGYGAAGVPKSILDGAPKGDGKLTLRQQEQERYADYGRVHSPGKGMSGHDGIRDAE